MSLPTTDTIFAQVRAADSWVEYPFLERGDPTAKIYHMKCSVNRDDYATIALNSPMTLAAAGVISLPFTSALDSYHVGDYGHQYIDGGLVEFDRQFATIPATRTKELVGSRSFGFPGFREVVYTPPSTAEAADTDDNLWDWKQTGSGNTNPSPLYLTSTYYKSADIPVSLPAVFSVTLGGIIVDSVNNGLIKTLTNSKALNGETFSGSINVAISSPSASGYSTSISNGDYLTVDVVVERYAGDLFVVKKYEMKAQ